ncbi:MAG: hypothetical protein AB7G11_02785 [Phycisphaerales bacterium]
MTTADILTFRPDLHEPAAQHYADLANRDKRYARLVESWRDAPPLRKAPTRAPIDPARTERLRLQTEAHHARQTLVTACDYRLPLDPADQTFGCQGMRYRCLAGRSPHECGHVRLGDCLKCVSGRLP